jgi:transposase
VWLVIGVVCGLDTAALHARRCTGGVGRAGYDPDMLLTVLIWAWAQGVRSSRVMERLCYRDVAFRIICAGDTPDHVTISRFRAEAADVMEQLFAQVLMWCARMGMGQLGVVAVDWVKIAANASLKTNHSAQGFAQGRRRAGRHRRRAGAGVGRQRGGGACGYRRRRGRPLWTGPPG